MVLLTLEQQGRRNRDSLGLEIGTARVELRSLPSVIAALSATWLALKALGLLLRLTKVLLACHRGCCHLSQIY